MRFPRSLNAINAFIKVSGDRKAKGINDPVGAEPTPLKSGADKYQIGKHNLEQLTGQAENGPKKSYAAFVPVIDTFLKEPLFADIFSRGVLTYQERELITVSALTSLGGVDSQLQGHLSISIKEGLSPAQLKQMIAIVGTLNGDNKAKAAESVLDRVLKAREDRKE